MEYRKILIKKWEESDLRKSIDTSFIEKVVYPAMEEYAQQQVKLFAIPDVRKRAFTYPIWLSWIGMIGLGYMLTDLISIFF